MKIRSAAGPDLSAAELYALLRLRAEVFVVEQACPYLDPDGRDLLPDTTHLWVPGTDGAALATLRVLRQERGWRIGRVVTAADARSTGLAAALVREAIDRFEWPLALDAQSHLAGWYATFGFEVAGPDFLEDGIPHTPMRQA